MMPRPSLVLALFCLAVLAGCRHVPPAPPPAAAAQPAARVTALLAADRAFAAQAEGGMVETMARMFDGDVFLLAGAELVRGRDSAVAALRRNPRNTNARAGWTPIRGGVSSDGTQGFTYGYITVTAADGAELPGKYVAYWRDTPMGWRVVAYKRTGRAAGPVSLALRPPSLPEPGLPARTDAEMVALEMELRAVEQAFSDRAQREGLGPAFAANGAHDAVNVGGPGDAEFRVGPAAIAEGVSASVPTDVTLTWSADHVVAARSGDLAVNLGYITARQAGQPEARRVPFLTVWRLTREGWRYVAE